VEIPHFCRNFIKRQTILMKFIQPKLFLLIFGICISLNSISQNVQANLDFKQFYNSETGTYLEVYVKINLASVTLKNSSEGNWQSQVEITQIIKKGDSIVDFRKKNLESPMMTDSTLTDFTDQQRYIIKPGEYELEIIIKDNYKENDVAVSLNEKLVINDFTGIASFSDIELLEAYVKTEKVTELTKSGFDLYPYVSAYFPYGYDKIAFYTEIYHLGKEITEGEKFLLVQYIESFENGIQFSNFSKMTKMESATVVPVLSALDISTLKTGNYNLVLEARNKTNDVVLTKKIFFQRNNPLANLSDDALTKVVIASTFVEKYNNMDSLSEYIACLRPICEELERTMVDKQALSGDTLTKKQFFYTFWLNRNPNNPEAEWLNYKKEVNFVNSIYGTRVRQGYETDRGRVYLQYGAPNQIADRPNEPSSYPYQIWQYYKVGKFNNKKFIFYLPDLVTNDYQILHSDVPGEMKNFRWETMLNQRNTPNGNVDSPSNGNFNHYGSRSGEFFQNPR
jgi:GWxTD domain-containing protein